MEKNVLVEALRQKKAEVLALLELDKESSADEIQARREGVVLGLGWVLHILGEEKLG